LNIDSAELRPVVGVADPGAVAPAGGRTVGDVLRENENLRRVVAISNHLSRMAIEGADLEAITRVLATSTGRTVAVLDPLLTAMATAAGREGDQPDAAWLSRDPQLVQVLGSVAESRQALRIPAAADLGRPGCVIAPILFGDEVFAYLVAVGGPEGEAGDFDLLVTEHAASAYAVCLARRRIGAEVGGRVRDDLVEALLLGHVRDEREGRQWAEAVGCAIGRPHRVLCMVPESLTAATGESGAGGPAAMALRRRLLQSLTQLVASQCASAIASARPEGLVVILPEPLGGERAVSPAGIGEVAIRHAARLVASSRLTVGVGGACEEPTELAQSYLQAQRAVGIARRLGKSGQLVVFEDLGIYRLLFQVPDNRELRAFAHQVLGPLVAYDREHRAGLVRTLSVYLRQNGSLHAAAGLLHIHPNTVNYRLTRIAEIASLCLNDHEDRLAAAVAVKILEVLDEG
jgi:sugar diacid utilization regulator